jgi:hypothetical protein
VADAAATGTAPFCLLHQQLHCFVITLTLLTVLPLHQADMAMCLCIFPLLLKNDGLFCASRKQIVFPDFFSCSEPNSQQQWALKAQCMWSLILASNAALGTSFHSLTGVHRDSGGLGLTQSN